MQQFVDEERYIIEYWPRFFDGYGSPAKRAPATVIQEFICRNSILSAWTGSYSTFSTHSISQSDIVRVINLKENS